MALELLGRSRTRRQGSGAPVLAELVPVLRRWGELEIDEDTAALLVGMYAATIDRRLGPANSKLVLGGRSHTKPGSLLKARIPMRTWADKDENIPEYVEIDLVGHEGGNPRGEFCFTLTVTDIAIGWTENRTVRNKAQVQVVAAISDVVEHLASSSMPPAAVLRRARTEVHPVEVGDKNEGAHVEQKNWTAVRQLVGYLRCDTPGVLLLNKIWVLQSLIGNHFHAQ